MGLRSNGDLLVKVKATPMRALFAAEMPLILPGYELEVLAPPSVARAFFDLEAPGDHWVHAKARTREATMPKPWDQAHIAARANDYAHYVEPDLIHDRAVPPGHLDGGMNRHWPPFAPHDDVSPGWHLDNLFTGFQAAHATATGKGVRIAHLDTGYTPAHASKPRNLKPELGHDYWDNKPDAIDPGTEGLLDNPGHGTATLAILAGGEMNLTFKSHHFVGDFGGAPDADVIPVRISPSVIHIYTSTMYKGLMHALAPGGDKSQRADVVTVSHGGLPCHNWADAVNQLYESGVVIVAASGDSIYLVLVDIATHYTVYPSAFNRVITALGVTYGKTPYITKDFGQMQGCWGPDSVMLKAIAAYTPNVAWMNYKDTPAGFEMSGGGTSASTPQVAAACALWLEVNKASLPHDWTRVEACRLALFDSADNSHPDQGKLGWGLLDASALLSPDIATKAIAAAKAGKPSHKDSVSAAFWRVLFGFGPPHSEEDRMYETEVAQLIAQTSNPRLRALSRAVEDGDPGVDRSEALMLLRAEDLSHALETRLQAAA